MSSKYMQELKELPLNTVEDAKKFFSRLDELKQQGIPLPQVNHLFFGRVDTGLDFDPYNIRTVCHDNCPSTFYVVTKTHVVRVNRRTGEHEVVAAMDSWIRDAKSFSRISKIPFFRFYLRLKALRCLIFGAQKIKFLRHRACIAKRALLTASAFQQHLFTARKKSTELQWRRGEDASLQEIASLQMDDDELRPQGYSVEEFTNRQESYIKMLRQRSTDVLAAINDSTTACCQSAKAAVDGMRVAEMLPVASGRLNKEVALADLRRSQMAQKRLFIDYCSLPSYIRLVQHIQVQALFQQMSSTFLRLDTSLQKRRPHLMWHFCTECVLSPTQQLSLTPTKERLLEAVQLTLDNSVSSLANASTCGSSTELADVIAGRTLTTTRSAANDDAIMRACKVGILSRIEMDYDEAASKLSSFETLRVAAAFVKDTQEALTRWEALFTSCGSILEAPSEPEFRSYATRGGKMQFDLSKLTSRSFGTITVACEAVSLKFIEEVERVRTSIEESLGHIISTNYSELNRECEEWVKRLHTPAPELAPFIAWVLELQEAAVVFDSFSSHVADLQGFYRLQAELYEKRKSGSPDAATEVGAALRDPFQRAIKDGQEFHAYNHVAVKDMLAAEYARITASLRETEQRLVADFSRRDADQLSSRALDKLKDIREELTLVRRVGKQLDTYAQVLNVDALNWTEIDAAESELHNYVELWRLVEETEQMRRLLATKEVGEVDAQGLSDTIVSLFQRAFKAQRATPGDTADYLVDFLATEKSNLPAYMELCHPALREEHWTELFKSASALPIPPSKRTVRALENIGLVNEENLAEVRKVLSGAVGVYELERHLRKLAEYWEEHLFVVVPYAGRANTFVVDAVDTTLEEVEEQQLTVQTCLVAKYAAPVVGELAAWAGKLHLIHAVLEEWVTVQKTWLYLEFIFTSDDIKRQLPDESLLFSAADRYFTSLMRRCAEDAHMASLCLDGEGDTLKKLKRCTHQLDCVQRKIDDYLETKRVAFPRFYFLSNDELLSILSDSRNPLAVQPHLQKCFDNIKSLVFADGRTIVAMRSREGEEVPFSHPVKTIGNVESWLKDVERAMRLTLVDRLEQCLRAYVPARRRHWFFEHPAQCVTTVDQIVWTREMEAVIVATGAGRTAAWSRYQDQFSLQLVQTVELVKNDLTALQRIVVSNLIVVDVHCRDVAAELAGSSEETSRRPPCATLLDFDWQKQLRFYHTPLTNSHNTDDGQASGAAGDTPGCSVRHGAAELPYGYEYLGDQPRLVITPLTERAFLTCTAALHMQKGAAPQGPAGTGKTESVKDLGKALARSVVVFNCSDGLDYRMMSQMFAGLAQSGAWACFDEFNRIDVEVLSVIAQQMLDITTAIELQQISLDFEGHRIQLNANFGVFVTMNPGYAGRTELPDNLKALFRPVCMMIPNYAMIAEILFYSEGYTRARVLATKMVRLYALASQQLSAQDHYDFGMRAVKAILVLAGRLKRAEPETDEDLLLVRSIREANVPKFLADDRQLFLALLRDFFPVAADATADVPMSDLIRTQAARVLTTEPPLGGSLTAALRLLPTQGLLSKTVQLFDTLATRHGLMLVGDTMTGKTTVRQTLARALTGLGELLRTSWARETDVPGEGAWSTREASSRRSSLATPLDPSGGDIGGQRRPMVTALHRIDARCRSYCTTTHVTTCNPKSLALTELYGDVNPLTREWQDGVFSAMIRAVVKNPTEATTAEIEAESVGPLPEPRHWIVFDGPVDAGWIENLNTVLDDSKMLCLVNGERIRIPDVISLLFEVQDLRVASPATVSRCGMVYVDVDCINDGWTPLLESLSHAAVADLGIRWRHERFMELCRRLLPSLLGVVRQECTAYVPAGDAQLALHLFYLLKAGVQQLCEMIALDKEEQEVARQTETASSSVVRARRSKSLLRSGSYEAAASLDAVAAEAARRASRRRSSLGARTSVLVHGDAIFDALFVQSCAWGLGGNLTESTRARFAAAMLPLVREETLYFPAEAEAVGCGVFDYAMDLETGNWRRWQDLVPPFRYRPGSCYTDILVPTEQTVTLQYLLRSATVTRRHLLLNGRTGTGKSSTVQGYLMQTMRTEDADSVTTAFKVTLSAQTAAATLQTTIESKLARRKGDREFGAPPGKQLVIAVVDDCNAPQLETYGASPPIELLRQMITQCGFYDRKKLFFKAVVQTMLVACCGEPGGGKHAMTPRFTSKLLCFCAPELPAPAMQAIFSSIVNGFFRTHGFAEEVAALADTVVDSTIAAYQRIAVECLPTPEKTHCTFNLRDVSKVIQGVLQVSPAHCTTATTLMQLWSHEAARVFHDRLVDDADRAWWWRCCAEVAIQHFPAATGASSVEVLTSQLPSILYGAWADRASREYQRLHPGPRLQAVAQQHLSHYNEQSSTRMDLVLFDEAVQHLSRICRILRQPRGHALLVGVGGSGRASLCHLAAFLTNMDAQTIHVTRNYTMSDFRDEMRKLILECGVRGKEVALILSDPQILWPAMLEDVNHLLNAGEVPDLMGPEEMEAIVRGCREACTSAGRPDTHTSIYNYFVSHCCERLHLCLCLSPMSCNFRERLRSFPALVNCTTIDWFASWPEGALLAIAHASFKTENTDKSAAGMDRLLVFMQATVAAAAVRLYTAHHRRTHVTPTSYLAVLDLYHSTRRRLRGELEGKAVRYQNGLEKLDSARRTVRVLEATVREMQPDLAAAAVQVAEQAEQLAVEQRDADALRVAQATEEARAQSLMNAAEALRCECESRLQLALPALEAAERALKTLSVKDIQELKTFPTPPANVEKTMNAVLVLLGEKEGWANAKVCLGKMDFISRLTGYPRDDIPAARIHKLVAFVQDPEFVPEVIEKSSLPCRSMCMWVHAMYHYTTVAKEILPRRIELTEAETKVAVARAELATKQAALQRVLETVKQLQGDAAAAQAKADHFHREIETAQARLVRADQLTHGLAEERVRWAAALTAVEEQLRCVEGTAMLAAGCIGYLGPFPLDHREELLTCWAAECATLGISHDAGCTLTTMEPETVVLQWLLHSLPRDTYSIQNATILHRSPRCCYLIDPQAQAHTFVRKMGRSRGHGGGAGPLQLKLSTPNFMRQVEMAMQKGQSVLLEDVGEVLDPALDPILLREVRRVNGRDVVVLGDREVPYDDRFRLYITTKLPSPVLTPELQGKLTVIDFTVTEEGLTEQLLADIVGSERVALQQRGDRCLVSIAAHRESIAALEAQVLQLLTEATGEVLDNVELIEALQTSKTTAEKVARELTAVEETNSAINTTRELYRPLAVRGSLVYGAMAQMATVDSMYQYALPFFKGLVVSVLTSTRSTTMAGAPSLSDAVWPSFTASTAMSPSEVFDRHNSVTLHDALAPPLRSRHASLVTEPELTALVAAEAAAVTEADVRVRVSMLIEELTWTSYRVLCRGLFAAHKLLFSVALSTTLLRSRGDIPAVEWSLFLRGAAGQAVGVPTVGSSTKEAMTSARAPSFLSSTTYAELVALCSLDAFADLGRVLLCSSTAAHAASSDDAPFTDLSGAAEGTLSWPRWCTGTCGPEVFTRMPAELAQLSLWHRLMAIKVLQPGQLHNIAAELVTATLGPRYTTAPAFDLEEVFADSNKMTPIIFILTPGVDPTPAFLRFSESRGFAERRYLLSLGQSQGPRAALMMRDGQRDGAWVYLQNCHVYTSWMPQLQALVGQMHPSEVHDDYRLWLTSSPSSAFPAAVLQAGLKLTQEPPIGLRGKVLEVLRSPAVVDVWANGESNGGGRSALQPLLWSLCLFHGTVMERRLFAPLGWNRHYDWGYADFATGVATIQTAIGRMTGGDGGASTAEEVRAELCYMLGTINYGGRVTDMWDSRCLQVLTECFFARGAASTGNRDTLLLPPPLPETHTMAYEDLLTRAELELGDDGDVDDPARFGLHANAILAVEQQRSSALMHGLVSLHTGGTDDLHAITAPAGAPSVMIGIAQRLLSELPAQLPAQSSLVSSARARISMLADPGPMQTVLAHETERYNTLLSCIATTLQSLVAALLGTAVMTSASELLLQSLAFNQVPQLWANVSFITRKPLASFMADLQRRVQFIRAWAARKTAPTYFWLPGLFFPQGFLTALMQARSRTLRVSIDSLQLRFRVLPPSEAAVAASAKPVVGAYVHGLYLEGGGWEAERGGLVESAPGALSAELPPIYFEPVTVAAVAEEQAATAGPVYSCPLYMVRSRAGALSSTGVSTNYVTTLTLPSLEEVPLEHWVLRGVAALCALDD